MSYGDGLGADERMIWDETLDHLARPTPERLAALEAYCIERMRQLGAEAWLRENGDTITIRTDKGEVRGVILAPKLKVAQQSQDRILRLLKVMGLRP